MWIDIHTHSIDESPDVYSLLSVRFGQEVVPENTLCTVGIHPWDCEEFEQLSYEQFAQVYSQPGICGVGETGLDRAIVSNFNLQKEVFTQHINIAEKFDLPLIVHCVRSYPDIISILKGRKVCSKTIFHGFRGNIHQVKQIVAHGCSISFSDALLRDIPSLIKAFQAVPLDKLFFETDTADCSIKDIYNCGALLRTESVGELRTALLANALRLGLPIFPESPI